MTWPNFPSAAPYNPNEPNAKAAYSRGRKSRWEHSLTIVAENTPKAHRPIQFVLVLTRRLRAIDPRPRTLSTVDLEPKAPENPKA